MLACVSSCDLGPNYKHPFLSLPTAWLGKSAPHKPPAWPSPDWWRGFNSPELDTLIARAKKRNFDLAAAEARVREADEQARLAGAALLPSANLGGTATRERTASLAGSYATGALLEPLASASYQLDFFGKNRALHEAALATAQASRFDQATVELTVLTSVGSTYFQILSLRDRLDIAEENYKNAQSILRGLKDEVNFGTATGLDVAQQEVVAATANAAIPPLRQQLAQASIALALLVGENPDNLGLVSASAFKKLHEPEVRPGLPSEVLLRRPDLAEAEANLVAANANIKAARASFFPSISLTAQGGFESGALSTLFMPGSRIFALAASATQPIFQGGALRAQLGFSKARYEELLANYRKAVAGAFGNVEDALSALRQTAEQQKRETLAVEKARLAYKLARTQMEAGTVNILTVMNTETALFTARDALAQARLVHLQSVIQLYNALGGGWRLPSAGKGK
jgi:NodT family efflux transporter outer membrane factor (OMF) lipoprotein